MAEVNATIVGQNQPVSNSEGSFSIDFGALKAKAAAMMTDDSTPEPTAPVVTEPVVAAVATADPLQTRVKGSGQVEAAPVAAEPAAPVEEAARAAIALGDDDLVEVTVDGETELVPWKDARGKISGGLKFTKSMQQLAQERKQFETERTEITTLRQERDNLKQLVSNQDALAHYATKAFGLQLTPAQAAQAAAAAESYNPDEIATVGETRTLVEQQQALLAQQLKDMRTSLSEELTQREAALAHREQTAKHAVVIDSTLSEILTKNPILNSIPDISDVIRYNVVKLNPQTEADAVAAFKQVAAGIVEDIARHTKQTTKVEKIQAAKAKLESKTIEPAGGSAVQIQPVTFKDANGQVNWNKVRDIAKGYSG